MVQPKFLDVLLQERANSNRPDGVRNVQMGLRASWKPCHAAAN